MVLYAISKQNKRKNIAANFHLYSGNFPESEELYENFNYTPFMFFSFSELEDCLICADDIYALRNLMGFYSILVNLSRKADIDILFAGQYYTQLQPKIRSLCKFQFYPNWDKETDVLHIIRVSKNNTVKRFKIRNAVKIASKYYNTKEKMPQATERKILDEILKQSKTLDDLDDNIDSYTTNSRKKQSLFKQLSVNFE